MTMPDIKNGSIDIKAQACLRGPAISIYEMSVDASSASAPKAFNMQIEFLAKKGKSLALVVVLSNPFPDTFGPPVSPSSREPSELMKGVEALECYEVIRPHLERLR
jgi:hypothetical protein